MLCLAIESSCDETSLALLHNNLASKEYVKRINDTIILAELVSSQIDTHKVFGGVIPEIGARMHADNIHLLFCKLLFDAEIFLNANSGNPEIAAYNFLEGIEKPKLEQDSKRKLKKLETEILQEYIITNINNHSSTIAKIFQNLNYIFVTTHPGLPSALRVGHEFAKTLKYFIKYNYNKNITITPINHLSGHVASSFFENKQ